MPDLSSLGVRLDGRGFMYLRNDTIIGQVETSQDVWKICTRPAISDTWTPISPHGASMIAARTGHWLGFLVGFGVFDAGGLLFARGGLAGDIQSGRGVASADGTLAVIMDYQSGTGLRLMAADGSAVEIPGASPTASICVVDRTRALWWDWKSHRIETCGGLPRPQVLDGPFAWPRVIGLSGEWWICYHSTDYTGVVLHPFTDPTYGYRLALPPAFYLAAVALDGTRVKVAWSLTPDDRTGREQVYDVARDPRVPLDEVPTPPLPPPPIPQPEPEPPVPEPIPVPPPVPPESPMPLTDAQKDQIFHDLGVIVKRAYPDRVRNSAEAAQGIRQAWDQLQDKATASDLIAFSLAREGGATTDEVEAAARAAVLLRRR